MCPFLHDPLFIHLWHSVREGPSPLPHIGSRPHLIVSLVRKRLPLVIHYPSHITLSLVRLLCYLMCAKSPQTPVFLHRSSRIDPYQPLWPISLIGEVANKKKSGWLGPEVTRLWQNYLPQHLSVNRCDPHNWESNVSAARALLAPRCMSSWSFYWFVTMRNVSRAIWFLHYFAVIGFWYWCVCVRAYVCKGDYKRMFISSSRWTKADVTLCGNIFVPEKYLWKEICLLALHLELFFPPNMSACKQSSHSWFKKKSLLLCSALKGV